MITTTVSVDGGKLQWPKEVPDHAYMIAYLHSELKIGRVEELDSFTLYEAWAFDGRTSWHLWQRDGEWVCTALDTAELDPSLVMRSRQYLSDHIRHSLKEKNLDKQYLEIHETIAFDGDGQAYVIYSCPIDLV